MNERIQKLAEQASEWYEQNVSGKGISGEWEIKFAELVIEEAFSEMARQMFLHCETQASDAGYMKAVANTKKRFGL